MFFVNLGTQAYRVIQRRFGWSEEGASMVEYALLVALIAIVCIVALTGLGSSISQLFSTTCTHLSTVNSAAGGSTSACSGTTTSA